jgi:hypothetical protein
MNRFILFAFCMVALRLSAQTAASVDLSKQVADPVSLYFDDAKKTSVKEFLYAMLESKTSCCGNDAVYMEVKIAPDGTVESARSLTGRNPCIRSSAVDIIKMVKWNNANIKATKAIYFDIKPSRPCSGQPTDNQYVQLGGGTTTPATADAAPADTKPAADKPAATEPAKADAKPAVTVADKKDAPKQTAPQPKQGEAPQTGEFKLVKDLPKQQYISAGDRKPNPEHAKTHANGPGPSYTSPEYVDGETMQSLYIKRNLRQAGVCGLVHSLAEITVEGDGNVSNVRVFRANTQAVADGIPAILKGLKFKPETVRYRQNVYIEFKADVDCPSQPAGKTKLNEVGNYMNTGETAAAPAPAKPADKPADAKTDEKPAVTPK